MATRAKQLKNLREAPVADVTGEMAKLREQLFKLRWQARGGTIEKPSRIREVRRAIARHLTVLRERELAAANKAGGNP